MKRLWERVRAMPAVGGWAGLVTLAILLAFGAWFFFFRGGGNVVSFHLRPRRALPWAKLSPLPTTNRQ